MGKAIVTQDFLYEYLVQHNVNISRLSELMNISNGLLMGCFRHDLNRHGKPMKFSEANIVKLNAALVEMSEQLRQYLITFGSDQVYTNNRGNTYDPGIVGQLKSLMRWVKLKPFYNRVIGWSQSKMEGIICSPASRMYGCITADDVARINAELLAVAGMLGGIEVETPDGNTGSSN